MVVSHSLILQGTLTLAIRNAWPDMTGTSLLTLLGKFTIARRNA